MKKITLALVLTLVLILTSCGGTDNGANSDSKIGLTSFETVDLDGNAVTEEIFSDYDVTMVNVWATWCPPCVAEMPALAKLYNQLPDNMNMIGICTDGATESGDAKAILLSAGASFTVLVPSEDMESGFLASVSAIPTTVFVDSEGNIIGKTQVGAPGRDEDEIADAYMDLMNDALNSEN